MYLYLYSVFVKLQSICICIQILLKVFDPRSGACLYLTVNMHCLISAHTQSGLGICNYTLKDRFYHVCVQFMSHLTGFGMINTIHISPMAGFVVIHMWSALIMSHSYMADSRFCDDWWPV